jgi:TonB family protein
MVKVAVYMIAFYLVYSTMLSRDTTYKRNRVFILLSLIAAMIFPLISLHTGNPLNLKVFGKLLSEVFISATGAAIEPDSLISVAMLLKIIYSIYIFVVLIYIAKLIIDLFNLLYLILRRRQHGSRIIIFHGFNTSGFSAMGYIFINSNLSPDDAEAIVRHEQNHLKQNHFIDIVFIEIVKAFQWFNPSVYLFNRSLRAIHEYQADEECLNSGVTITSYQNLLFNQVFKTKAFNMTNSFSNPSLIKKRMVMMSKKRTATIANMKLLIVIPIISIVFLAVSAYKEIPRTSPIDVNNNTASDQMPAPPPPPPPPPPEELEKPYVVVEEMPMFPGGDEALLKYIGENTRYPASAKSQNIEGKVIVRFCVTAKGGVSQISVLRAVSPELDAEAIRVVSTLPDFKPGRQGGENVPVWYMVPIAFTLK